MNRLRGDRVLVELMPLEKSQEDKDGFKQTETGLFLAKEETSRKAEVVELRQAKVLMIGHDISPRDIAVGMTVYVKLFQGERIYEDVEHYLYKERDIIGND